MSNNKNIFYSKIMLFGEYSVICGSMGLSIPYSHYKGELSFINDDKYTDLDFAKKSNQELKRLALYLENLQKEKKLLAEINLEQLKKDLDSGLYFESSIPQSYGVGSSGALCAAIYDQYYTDKIPRIRRLSKAKIVELRSILAQIESFFHGMSSGTDPLNSYLNTPLIIHNDQHIESVGIPRNKHDKNGAIFLINTGAQGSTEPLVKLFFENSKKYSFYKKVQEEMIPLNNQSILSLVDGNTKGFFENLKEFSKFQLENMKEMIPQQFLKIWGHGIGSDDFYLKLCGSGGGGFLLGFTHEFDKVAQLFRDKNVEIIPVYKND